MRKLPQKILTLALLLSLLAAPTAFAFAQVDDAAATPAADVATPVAAPDVSPAGDSAPADPSTYIDASAPVPGAVNPQDTIPLQDTAPTQSAVTGDQLENTANPADATSTIDDSSIIPIADASTTATTTDPAPVPVQDASSTPAATPIDTGSTTVEVAASIDTSASSSEPAQTIVNVITVTEVQTAGTPLVETPDAPKYDFGLTGKTIASKKKIKNAAGQVIGETDVTAPLNSSVDSQNNALNVSGQCSDKYFVVLLYKNSNDYDTDPRSYIFNSAFPCVNGSYSYAISDLPSSLTDGTYYLLIGSEDDVHPWVPITGVTEITINRAQH